VWPELVKGVLYSLGLALGSFILSRIPVVGDYLTITIPVPAWALLAAALVVAVIVWLLIRWRPLRQAERSRGPAKFSWKGLDWPLGPDFWGFYEYTSVLDLSDSLLTSAIRDPECCRCHEDATAALITGNRCRNCSYEFETNSEGLAPWASEAANSVAHAPEQVRNKLPRLLLPTKREVYPKAQAAAKRGEIRRS